MDVKKILLAIVTIFLFFSTSCAQSEQNKVPDDVMEGIYNEIKTPHKYGL